MYIPKDQAKKFTLPGKTEGSLYPSSPQEDQTIAMVETDGKYPESGYSVNDVATETILLLEGGIEVYTHKTGRWQAMEKGDLFMVLPRTKYKLRGKGKCAVFITPAWEKNNNQIIEE